MCNFCCENGILLNRQGYSIMPVDRKFPSGANVLRAICVAIRKRAFNREDRLQLRLCDNEATLSKWILARQLPSMNQRIKDA